MILVGTQAGVGRDPSPWLMGCSRPGERSEFKNPPGNWVAANTTRIKGRACGTEVRFSISQQGKMTVIHADRLACTRGGPTHYGRSNLIVLEGE